MSETRDKTATQGVQMDDGSNRGREVSRATPGQQQGDQRAVQIQRAHDGMLVYVENHRAELVQFLSTFNIDYEFFVGGLRIFLLKMKQDPSRAHDFFTKVSAESFLEALFRCAKDGLVPDGKEAAIASYGSTATYMPMRDGFVKVLWRTGLIKDINDNVVTEAEEAEGRFEYEEGDHGYIKHRPSMKRTDADVVLAAYCVIRLTNGGVLREVVGQSELAKIAAMSKSPARKAWIFQMTRKAAIRRIMGKMPRESGIAQLLTHDDLNYDLNTAPTPERRPVPAASLLSDKAHTTEEPRAQTTDDLGPPIDHGESAPAGAPAGGVADAPQDDDASFSPERAASIIRALKEIEDADGAVALGLVLTGIAETKLVDDCTVDEVNRINAAIAAKKKALGFAEPARLLYILTKADGVQEADDPAVWAAALTTRIGQLEGAGLSAFWAANLDLVMAAREDYPDEAASVLERAASAGLQVEP